MFPSTSAATPSAALVPVVFSTGSGMNAVTDPSRALPMRMPRFHPSWFRDTDSDSESAT
jgi:hypothetical protein